jgi:hypothetical protein
MPLLSYSERVDTQGGGSMVGRVLHPQVPGGQARLHATLPLCPHRDVLPRCGPPFREVRVLLEARHGTKRPL